MALPNDIKGGGIHYIHRCIQSAKKIYIRGHQIEIPTLHLPCIVFLFFFLLAEGGGGGGRDFYPGSALTACICLPEKANRSSDSRPL